MTENFTLPANVGGGAYATTINEALASLDDLVFNVMAPAFGATGDGIDDDTTAVQDAIDAASNAGGGTVLLPRNHLTGALTIEAPGVHLVGNGRSSLRLKDNTNLPLVTFDGVDGGGVRFLQLDANKVENDSPPGQGNQGIYIADSQNIDVLHNSIKDPFHDGINVLRGKDCNILGNRIEGAGLTTTSGSAAIKVFNTGSGDNCEDILIQGNRVKDCVSGIFVTAGDDTNPAERVQILGNRVKDCTGTSPAFAQDGGIACSNGVHELVVGGNIVTGCSGRGIHVFGYCEGATVDHNQVRDCGSINAASGIDVGDEGDLYFVVTNNQVWRSGAAGIYVVFLVGSIISNNICANNGQNSSDAGNRNGITLSAETGFPVRDNQIIGNVCFDTQSVKTQEYGIREWNSGSETSTLYHHNSYIGNNVRTNKTGQILVVEDLSYTEFNMV